MTLQQMCETLENPDMLQIIKDGKVLYTGYLGILIHGKEFFDRYGGQQVKKVRAVPEIRHKRWKELNLERPLRPDETPDFYFKDLQMKLYYRIYI